MNVTSVVCASPRGDDDPQVIGQCGVIWLENYFLKQNWVGVLGIRCVGNCPEIMVIWLSNSCFSLHAACLCSLSSWRIHFQKDNELVKHGKKNYLWEQKLTKVNNMPKDQLRKSLWIVDCPGIHNFEQAWNWTNNLPNTDTAEVFAFDQ